MNPSVDRPERNQGAARHVPRGRRCCCCDAMADKVLTRRAPRAEATVYVGGLDDQVTEDLLWEFFLQAGPVGAIMQPP